MTGGSLGITDGMRGTISREELLLSAIEAVIARSGRMMNGDIGGEEAAAVELTRDGLGDTRSLGVLKGRCCFDESLAACFCALFGPLNLDSALRSRNNIVCSIHTDRVPYLVCGLLL